MPAHKYTCPGCGLEEERIVTFSALDEQQCPSCGVKMARGFNPGYGFDLQGGGWFKDGYSSSWDRAKVNIKAQGLDPDKYHPPGKRPKYKSAKKISNIGKK